MITVPSQYFAILPSSSELTTTLSYSAEYISISCFITASSSSVITPSSNTPVNIISKSGLLVLHIKSAVSDGFLRKSATPFRFFPSLYFPRKISDIISASIKRTFSPSLTKLYAILNAPIPFLVTARTFPPFNSDFTVSLTSS